MSNVKVGILGGGQLAMMGLQAAKDLGIDCLALVNSQADPAAKAHPENCYLSTEVEAFANSINTLTFESEFFDPALFNFVITSNPKIAAMPRSSDILMVSDKLEQKKIFSSLGIDQSRYWKLDEACFESALYEALDASEGFCVLKWAKGGYDGKGNLFLRQSSNKLGPEEFDRARSFCEQAWRNGAAAYAEEGIAFEAECALLHAQALDESEGPASVNYPVVQTCQKDGVCLETWGAKGSELDSSDAGVAARNAAALIAAHFPKLPVFAIEFFLTKDGRLLANEMAPRVHNSGHYSLLNGSGSQFHNWMRSLAGMPLEPWSCKQGFVMRNWLGGDQAAVPNFAELKGADIQFIEYLKEHRRGRKLGHLSRWVGEDESFTSVKEQLEKLDPAYEGAKLSR